MSIRIDTNSMAMLINDGERYLRLPTVHQMWLVQNHQRTQWHLAIQLDSEGQPLYVPFDTKEEAKDVMASIFDAMAGSPQPNRLQLIGDLRAAHSVSGPVARAALELHGWDYAKADATLRNSTI